MADEISLALPDTASDQRAKWKLELRDAIRELGFCREKSQYIGLLTLLYLFFRHDIPVVRGMLREDGEPQAVRVFKVVMNCIVIFVAAIFIVPSQFASAAFLIYILATYPPVDIICGSLAFDGAEIYVFFAISSVYLAVTQLKFFLKTERASSPSSYHCDSRVVAWLDISLEYLFDYLTVILSFFIMAEYSSTAFGFLLNVFVIILISDIDNIFVDMYFSNEPDNAKERVGLQKGRLFPPIVERLVYVFQLLVWIATLALAGWKLYNLKDRIETDGCDLTLF